MVLFSAAWRASSAPILGVTNKAFLMLFDIKSDDLALSFIMLEVRVVFLIFSLVYSIGIFEKPDILQILPYKTFWYVSFHFFTTLVWKIRTIFL